METLKLKEDLFWIGILDPDLRIFDIVMETKYGTSYNSYILKGSEKTAIFETAKLKFFDTYLKKLEQLINIQKIDYIIMNHTEPDHAGSIEKLLEINPDIEIVGTKTAINFLKNIVNGSFKSRIVDENDTLSLGNKTLHFMRLPNLHWPDTMYTYVEEDKVLFTCDSFGAHYSFDGVLLSKVTDHEGYWKALMLYFDDIISPFKKFMVKALDRIKDLDVEMIATGHGPVIDTDVQKIKEVYREWCEDMNPNVGLTVVIPYVSAYGYTKTLALEIARGISKAGPIEARLFDMVTEDKDEVLREMHYADGILFGTPTILGDALKPIWDLTTSIFAVTHCGKLASAFGSYGWSGEAVPNILERLKQLRLRVVDGLKVKFKPGGADRAAAYEYGYAFGCTLQKKDNPQKAAN